MSLRPFRVATGLASLASSLALAGCGDSTSSTSTAVAPPSPAAANHPSDPASKGATNTPPPKPR